MTPLRDVALLEYRTDRPYDEQSPSMVCVPAGDRLTLAATLDRHLAAAFVRAVLDP